VAVRVQARVAAARSRSPVSILGWSPARQQQKDGFAG
jgi:hypothetical protein